MKLRPRVSSALPRGFCFAATACGLKKAGRLDLALASSETPATAAAVFTTNQVQAAPVILSRAHLWESTSRMRVIVVNSGNANCATGPAGMAAARAIARGVARAVRCRPEEVIVCSTGVIGVPLRVERILRALPQLVSRRAATSEAFAQLTHAILTTDTRPKWAAARCRIGSKEVRLLGCAKGAGMIHPQMATMLAFIFTDGVVSPAALRRALRETVRGTFNAITVDGDTSTNDTVAVLANGASGCRPIRPISADYQRFCVALGEVCRALALAIVADGEGAQRVAEIEVRGAPSKAAADQVARTIANSPLVKTALAGADPNWGRILAAAGRSGVGFDPERAEITLAGIKVFSRGRPRPFDERLAHRRMLSGLVPIQVDLGLRRPIADRRPLAAGGARVWTCDFTADYVRINASYRT